MKNLSRANTRELVLRVQETADHESRAAEQYDCQRELQYDQSSREIAAAQSSRAPCAFLECVVEIDTRSSQCRRNTKYHSCQHAHCGEVKQHHVVDREIDPIRFPDILNGEGKPSNAKVRQYQAQDSTGHGQNNALYQQLSDEPPPPGPKCGPNGNFAAPVDGFAQQHVGDIRAGDLPLVARCVATFSRYCVSLSSRLSRCS
jgi:hypothetical protein